METTICITGASRGIGLEFCKQYLEQGARVIATCRHPGGSAGLAALQEQYGSSLSVHPLDVCAPESVRDFAAALKDTPLDILINNAGVYGPSGQFTFPAARALDEDVIHQWQDVLQTNTIAPLAVTTSLLGNVQAGAQKKVVIISSRMGSIEDNNSGKSYIYRSSKAAVNAVAKSLSLDLAGDSIAVVLLHPGWVRTGMGGENAPLNPPESVSGMRGVIEQATAADPCRLLSYNGDVIPW